MVSGFDPSDIMRISENEMPVDKNGKNKDGKGDELAYLYDIANKNDFLDKLRDRGYDVIAYRCVNSKKNHYIYKNL